MLKTWIAVLLLSVLCVGNPHYTIKAEAYPCEMGTYFLAENGHVFGWSEDRFSGECLLIMDNMNTPDNVTDDVIDYTPIELGK